MAAILQALLAALNGALFFGAVASFGAGLFFTVMTIQHEHRRKSRHLLWRFLTRNLVQPTLLTEEGRRCYRLTLWAMLVFAGCIACLLLIGALTGRIETGPRYYIRLGVLTPHAEASSLPS
jgi:hypothetical protein